MGVRAISLRSVRFNAPPYSASRRGGAGRGGTPQEQFAPPTHGHRGLRRPLSRPLRGDVSNLVADLQEGTDERIGPSDEARGLVSVTFAWAPLWPASPNASRRLPRYRTVLRLGGGGSRDLGGPSDLLRLVHGCESFRRVWSGSVPSGSHHTASRAVPRAGDDVSYCEASVSHASHCALIDQGDASSIEPVWVADSSPP